MCFSNYTILPLYRPADPAKPCLSCTKWVMRHLPSSIDAFLHFTDSMLLPRQFCLDQKLAICKDASLGDADPDTATGNEGDIQTRCFREYDSPVIRACTRSSPCLPAERDSALSYSVVVIFIILTLGLLVGAATKERFAKQLQHTPLQAWIDVRGFSLSHAEHSD